MRQAHELGPISQQRARDIDVDRVDVTVIIPAFNEAGTIGSVLTRLAGVPLRKQTIVVDDGSTDGTATAVAAWARADGEPIEYVHHTANCGKGAAIRSGLALARGEVTVIQDADLEYDPADLPRLVTPILNGDVNVAYGSRYLNQENSVPWTRHRCCVHLLNGLVRLLYGRRITDEATCYKAFRTDLLRSLDLRCRRFEFCPEVTAKLCRLGISIAEVPIRYHARTAMEGKKIGWWDGLAAMWTLLHWRVARMPGAAANRPSRSAACM